VNETRYRLEFAEGVRKQLERLHGHIYPRVKRIVMALPAATVEVYRHIKGIAVS
jgi:hypothetical protein